MTFRCYEWTVHLYPLVRFCNLGFICPSILLLGSHAGFFISSTPPPSFSISFSPVLLPLSIYLTVQFMNISRVKGLAFDCTFPLY